MGMVCQQKFTVEPLTSREQYICGQCDQSVLKGVFDNITQCRASFSPFSAYIFRCFCFYRQCSY